MHEIAVKYDCYFDIFFDNYSLSIISFIKFNYNLSEGVHMTTLCPRMYCHQATIIDVFTVRKYVGIFRNTLDIELFFLNP